MHSELEAKNSHSANAKYYNYNYNYLLREPSDTIKVSNWPSNTSINLEIRPIPGPGASVFAAVDSDLVGTAVDGKRRCGSDEVDTLRIVK